MIKKTFQCPHCEKYVSFIVMPEENKISKLCSGCKRSSPKKLYCHMGIIQATNKRVCSYFEEKRGRT